MPIEYQRDDLRRVITVTLIEPISLDELLSQTDRQWVEGVWEYAVLYDARAISHSRPPDELQRLVDHTRVVGGGKPRGPVGVAIPTRAETVRSGLDLAARAGPLRDIEILLNETQVKAWLVRNTAVRRARLNRWLT
jgi:hypothetical protein